MPPDRANVGATNPRGHGLPAGLRTWSPYSALFTGLVLIGLATLPPGNYGIDGASMLAVSDSLVRNLSFAVPCDLGVPGRGGECFSQWYPLLSVVMVPFVALGRGLASIAAVPARPVEVVVALLVSLLSAAGAAVFTALIARELDAGRRAAIAAGVALFFGTELLTYSRRLYTESLCALLVAVAAWGLLGSGRRRVAGHLAIALAVLAKPTMVFVGLGLAAALAAHERSLRPVLTAAAATAVGGLLYLGYNELRFDDLLYFRGSADSLAQAIGDYGHPDSKPIPIRAAIGLGVLLVSPGNGLLLYSPLAVLGAVALIRARRNPVAAVCLAGAVAVLAAYLLQPYGGNWGTRYLVPALPLLIAGVATLRGRAARLAIALACLTFVSQLPNLVAINERYYREGTREALAEGRPSPEYDVWNRSSQLVGVWSSASRQLSVARRTSPDALLQSSRAGGRRELLRTVAQWWWVAPAVGIPRWLGLGIAVVLFAAGVLLIGVALTWRVPSREKGTIPPVAPGAAGRG